MMVNKNPARVDSTLAANMEFRKRSWVFVITCAATFLFLVAIYSMRVEGFVSESIVRLAITANRGLSEDQIRQFVSQAWKRQLGDEQLESDIDELKQMIHLTHPVILGKNLDRLRKQLDYELETDLASGVCEVRLQIEGDGSTAESALLKMVAQNIAGGISKVAANSPNESSELIADVELGSEIRQAQNENIDRAEQLVDQLDFQIERLRRAMRNNETPFRNAAHSSNSNNLDSLLEGLDEIDVSSVRSTIAKMRQACDEMVEFQKKQLEAAAGEPSRTAAFLVQGVAVQPSRPIGGVPTRAIVLAFAVFSIVAGSVVSWGYLPLRDEAGFASAQQLQAKLNLPVIATLKRPSDITQLDDEFPLANLAFQLAKVILLGILLVVVVGMAISPTIRSTFSENPYHAFSHIMWNLLGK